MCPSSFRLRSGVPLHSDGPPARGLRPALDPSTGTVEVVAHHLVVDAVSWRILLMEWLAVYAHHAHGAPLTLAPPTRARGPVRRLPSPPIPVCAHSSQDTFPPSGAGGGRH